MSAEQWSGKLYRAEQVRLGERQAAAQQSLAMYQLMERAGTAVFQELKQDFTCPCSVLVCCGGGNNGGDGYVVARLARDAGYQVTLWQMGDAAKLQGDAALARDAWLATGGQILPPAAVIPSSIDVVIDALLGTGLSGEVRPEGKQLISMINQIALPVIAIDIPSGLCADTGKVLGEAVKAQSTVTFIGSKQGLWTAQAAEYVGLVKFAGLQVADDFEQIEPPSACLIQAGDVASCLPPRSRSAHKGDHGRIILAGGDHGMGGAIRMASEAAARSGAGLTAVLTQPDNVLSIVTARPEIMATGWQQTDKSVLVQRLKWADVLVLGPGLGQSDWSEALYRQLADSEKSLVVDADGLNLLARSPDYKNNRIITPHPGEAARLLACSVQEVEADRFRAVRALQQKYGGVAVLKGAGTLVDDGNQCWVCAAGNPGMATGGMGDVLSGIIGALLGQGLSLAAAARCGVWIHSTAADRCAAEGERGMLAGDLFPHIRQLVNPR
ncbi:bifunctional ADP-dependent NAD(P)H-hydrate dehydratase/NAD(P)H-hydrate epimerase [Photobacterium rosenbergii]|uniref:Bifunctional NAD(P)H-hydrate repair enzyme n=1 Tax=Photobacterium rosenbergii TaxID=294936 RepID=A0A2T3N5L0_9GAMM|nr:NAD(P)H-hydrate dehydratase [Photobacterium rosenbergii]PSW07707.1 bifunctional ADP-dependent NAD(P)H-hydrate dehydratase/NAD(P)H-hydrate epimerase [Photobacterium rosenbergii]